MESAAQRKATGTREWSQYSFNIGLGCGNDCRYCYAAAKAAKPFFGARRARAEWSREELTGNATLGRFPDRGGAVTMFPTTHDISPFYLPDFIRCAQQMLQSGDNPLLIVSKPRFGVIKELAMALEPWREAVEFRFTIGSMNADVVRFWEPHASPPHERLTCLALAAGLGYRVSVSLEPMLEGPLGAYNVLRNVRKLIDQRSGTVWVGRMNNPGRRVDMSLEENRKAVARIKQLQADDRILELVTVVENSPELSRIVRWKDSIQDVIGRVRG